MAKFEHEFLQLNAGRHFVVLTFRLKRGEGSAREVKDDYASCFLVDVEGWWFLMTAGHVVHALKKAIADGWVLRKSELGDAFAGSSDHPLPFSFEVSKWMSLEDDESGADLAALHVDPFYCRGLQAAGVEALEQRHIRSLDFDDYDQVIVVGVPAESVKVKGPAYQMKFMLVPVTRQDPTPLMVEKPATVLARMGADSGKGPHAIGDARGMSGCPVFGIELENGKPARYSLIGLQSSWSGPTDRIVRLCSVDWFVDVLRDSIKEIGPQVKPAA